MNELLAAYAAQQAAESKPAASPAQRISSPRNNQSELEASFKALNIGSSADRTTDQFFHSSLKDAATQIRLILLSPGKKEQERIDCALQVVTLKEAKDLGFTAISYACGDQNNRKDVFINGLKLSVTYNLHEALINLRHDSNYQRVWADAICIHQTNLPEKSKQILLMQEIYSYATQVFVWLGTSDNDLDALFQRLSSVDAEDKVQQTSTFYNIFQYAQEQDQLTRAFIKLWQKPWFSRVWCTQEYLLASEAPIVACGDSRLSWNVINMAMVTVDMIWPDKKSVVQRQLQEASTHSLAGAMDVTYKHNKGLALSEALNYTSTKQATEPRDKIYAVLGLVAPSVRDSLTPDYTQSLSSIYQKAMVVMCKEHMVLTPLRAAADTKTDPGLRLPSWCLDFSDTHWQNQFVELHEFPLLGGVRGACGLGPTAAPGHIEHDPNTSRLTVHGTIVGTIKETLATSFTSSIREHNRLERSFSSEPDPNNETRLSELKSETVHQFLNTIKAASQLAYTTLSTKFGNNTAQSRIVNDGEIWKLFHRGSTMRELIGNIWSGSGLALPTSYSIFESFLWQQPAGNNKPTPSTWNHDIPPQDRTRISHPQLVHDCLVKSCLTFAQALPDRTFIVTDTGYTGRASRDVKAGDLLCIMFRCGDPLILRPSGVDEKGETVYELVASAWVSGIMGGQFLRSGNFPRYRFTLV